VVWTFEADMFTSCLHMTPRRSTFCNISGEEVGFTLFTFWKDQYLALVVHFSCRMNGYFDHSTWMMILSFQGSWRNCYPTFIWTWPMIFERSPIASFQCSWW
jgi:hypothetical protein